MNHAGPWEIECRLDDGARLSRLRYDGVDLLTRPPAVFRPPRRDYGRYETRPVYGYDDCFPTVDAAAGWPDHGELCWLAWQGAVTECAVRSRRWPVTFTRRLRPAPRQLVWSFTVQNHGDQALPFQHVMHPLLPLDQITGVELPAAGSVFDDLAKKELALPGWDLAQDIRPIVVRGSPTPHSARPQVSRPGRPGRPAVAPVRGRRPAHNLSPAWGDPDHRSALVRYLLERPAASTTMLFARDIAAGRMAVTFRGGLRLEMRFPEALFPTIGIWWNNGGYPDEDGLRRTECAFEPTPGPTSRLSDGTTLTVQPQSSLSWEMIWEIT